MNALGLKDHVFLPYFIGDGSERTFFVGRAPMTSSLYRTDEEMTGYFNQLPEVQTPVREFPVATTRLDDVPEASRCDYLKIDVQGAELDVLRGGERLLRDVLVIQVELEFLPLYGGQATFSDVEPWLRERGFLLHTIPLLSGRTFRPFAVADNSDAYVNQILWGEFTFVRDFRRLADLSEAQLLKLAVILHDVYRSVDLVALVLQHLDRRTGVDPRKGLWHGYVARAVPPALFPGGSLPQPTSAP